MKFFVGVFSRLNQNVMPKKNGFSCDPKQTRSVAIDFLEMNLQLRVRRCRQRLLRRRRHGVHCVPAALQLRCGEHGLYGLPMRRGLCRRRRHDVPTMQRRQLLDRRRGQLLSLPSWLLVACGQCVGLELLMQCGLLQRCCCSRTGKITVPQRLDKCA